MKRGHIYTYIYTLQLLDQIGPVGRFRENLHFGEEKEVILDAFEIVH